jgi:hypothetical protein
MMLGLSGVYCKVARQREEGEEGEEEEEERAIDCIRMARPPGFSFLN